MKKTHKKAFGLFGLAIVTAMTVFAAFLPAPGTRAVENEDCQGDVCDSISIRVVGSTPYIDVSGIVSGSVSSNGEYSLKIPYENIEWLKIAVTYTGPDGVSHENTVIQKNVNYETGEAEFNFNTLTGAYNLDEITGTLDYYGYGDYTITVTGVGAGEVETNPAIVQFENSPVGGKSNITVESEGGEDKYYLNVDYNKDGDGSSSEQVDHIVVRVYDEAGNEVKFDPPIVINAPATRVEIPFESMNLDDGTYTFKLTAYNAAGQVIYKDPAYEFNYDYVSGNLPAPHSANTGGMIGTLNISRADYIVTGLIIFGIVGVSGAVFISRHDKKTARRRRK